MADPTTVPPMGLGTFGRTGPEGLAALLDALEAGYRHLDTAQSYGTEANVGEAVRRSGLPRSEVFVTTKLPPERAGAAQQTLDASLTALGVDAVDLWLVHWPPGGAGVDLWRQFVTARDSGRARAIGVSNYSLRQMDALTEATGVTPAVNQVRWAPSLFDAELLAGHRERGVVLEGYSPFKSTDLDDPVLREVADAHGVSPQQVALAWELAQSEAVVPIPGASRPESITDSAAAADLELSADELARLDQAAG